MAINMQLHIHNIIAGYGKSWSLCLLASPDLSSLPFSASLISLPARLSASCVKSACNDTGLLPESTHLDYGITRLMKVGPHQARILQQVVVVTLDFPSISEETTGVTFDDFAGQDYIKQELQEILRILRSEEGYRSKGIYCPKGVLLHGPPGTGKTLLAKAIAGEVGLPFFAVNGTGFVEMFAGVAASRVRDLFASDRSYAPPIIFIDEIDAIGSKRGGPDIEGVVQRGNKVCFKF